MQLQTLACKTWDDDKGHHIRDIALDESGQLAVVDGLSAYHNIVEAVIRTLRGEMPLWQDEGVDYFGTVFKSPRLVDKWRAQVLTAVQRLSFVEEVESFEVRVHPVLTYSMQIRTDLGEIDVNG